MSDSFKTPKGTELFYLNLKGKKYLQVADRLIWFREDRNDWRIWTTLVEYNQEFALVRAEIADPEGHILATAHKQEHRAQFYDMIEKAETAAIGRALAYLGYGTQFAQELETPDTEDGPKIVDSPRAPKPTQKPAVAAPKASKPIQQPLITTDETPIAKPLVVNTPTGNPDEKIDALDLKTLVKERDAAKMTGDELKALVAKMFGPIEAKNMTLSQFRTLIDAIRNRDVT